MYNAANKPLILAAAAALTLATYSCSDNSRSNEARQMLENARMLVESNPDSVLTMLDTLDSRYADQTDVRRQAMQVRASAIEKSTMRMIEKTDYQLASLTLKVDSLRPLFTHIDGTGLVEGYYIDREIYSPSQMNSTMVQPRIDDSYNLYLVAQSRGKSIGMSTITFSGNGVAATTAPVSDMRRITVEGSEMMSVLPEECKDALSIVAADPTAYTTATINGEKGSVAVKLTPKLQSAIAHSVAYSNALLELKAASILREKLERQLAISRNHKAETSADTAVQ